MSFGKLVIIAAVVMVGGTILIARFAVSDFIAPADQIMPIIETKPWRPFARLVFGFIMELLLIVGTVGALKYKVWRS